MKQFSCIALAVASILILPGLLRAEPPPEIRVLVIDGRPQVTIEGEGSALKIRSASGRDEERLGAAVRIAAGEAGLVISGAERGRELSLTCAAGRYHIEGRSFRGTLTVVWKERGRLQVIDQLPLEDYLSGLINSEISSSWPLEAIKAQAVAARTYAMHQIEGARRAAPPRPYDLTSTVLDQVYDGAHQEDFRSQRAVAATRGEFLVRGGTIFPAYYHSCCGGRTEAATNVWPGEQGPPPLDDPYCARSPKRAWSYRMPLRGFIEGLRAGGIALNVVRQLVATQDDSPRVDLLLIEDDDGPKMVKATFLRKVFGYQNIKSTWFDVGIEGHEVVFTGRGYGHGVGLCQWGAKGMADEGIGYRDILKFYYSDADVVTLY